MSRTMLVLFIAIDSLASAFASSISPVWGVLQMITDMQAKGWKEKMMRTWPSRPLCRSARTLWLTRRKRTELEKEETNVRHALEMLLQDLKA